MKSKAKALSKAKENIHGVKYSTPAEQKKKLAGWPKALKGNGIGRGTNDASRNVPPGHDYQSRSKYSR